MTPIEGYRIKDVKINGNSVGAVSTYSFIAGGNTTIDVSFEPLPVIFVSPAEPPVALISTPDEFAMAGVPVKLDGTQSYARTEGATLTYEWTLCARPQNSSAAVAEPVSPLTEFIPDVAGMYQAQLVVNDGVLSSAPVDVIIAVHERDVPPNAVIKSVPPVTVGVAAALNGTESNDPDAWPGPLSYHWNLVTVPQGSLTVIINPDEPTASFVPDVAGDYSVRLTVDDGMFSSEASTTITAVRANVPPVAEAGQNVNILLGQKAQLDGSASSDPDTWPSALTYQWSFVSVPAGSTLVNAGIDRADTSTPSFVPDKEGVYVLQLAVNDGANSAVDTVSVTVSRTASLCAVLGKDGDRRLDAHLYRFTGKKRRSSSISRFS